MQTTSPALRRSFSLLTLCSLALSGQARADATPTLPEVTVTANKLAQPLESVPASVSVLDGETLEASGVYDLASLANRVPGFTFQAFGQSGIQPPVMRGMTANFVSFSSSTLLLVDGVPTLMAQGFENNLQAVDRVEVLRGPQSTLYGRNAEAGVVSIHTLAPGKEPRTQVSLEAGTSNRSRLRVDLSRPLVEDTLYIGLSGEFAQQDGFIDNLASGQRADDREQHNGRLALRWTPSADTQATLRYSQQEYQDGASQWGAVNAPRATVRSGTPSWNRSTGNTLSVDVEHSLTPDLRLRSITARNEFLDRVQQDTDFAPADTLHIGRDYRLTTVSQELRLEGKAGDNRWLAGLYLDRDDNDLRYEQKLPLVLNRTAATLRGDSSALFTHWTMPLAQQWTVEAGARVEHKRVGLTPVTGSERQAEWSRFTPKLSLQYQWAPQAQVYASATQGYRAGGFNAFTAGANYPSYQPESVIALEFGVKGKLDDQRLRYSASVYSMEVRDMQVQQMGLPGVVYITNAATARSTGAEFELEYLLGSGWQLQAALGLNRTRFGEFRDGANVYDGKSNPFAPDANAHLALRYNAPAGWYAQGAITAVDQVYLDAANLYSRPGYALLDLAAGYTKGAYEMNFYVRNVANQRYDAVGYLNGQVTVYSPPREAGVRLTWRI